MRMTNDPGDNCEPGTGFMAGCQSGKADFQDEVTEPDMCDAAASPVHNPGQQDDGKDDQNKPCKEQHDPGDGVPSYGPGSSHDGQLPADA